MSSVRVIRKYPNRRLYDTEDSRYITLSDIRDLVSGMVQFVVVDKKNGSDITRCVLMQVISEQEQSGDPVMSQAFLSEIIRHRDQLVSARLSTYLEQCLAAYLGRHADPEDAGAVPSSSGTAKARAARWKSSPGEGQRRVAMEDETDPSGTREIHQEQKKAS